MFWLAWGSSFRPGTAFAPTLPQTLFQVGSRNLLHSRRMLCSPRVTCTGPVRTQCTQQRRRARARIRLPHKSFASPAQELDNSVLLRSRGRLFALRCPCIFLQHSPCTVRPPRRRPFQQRNHRRRDHAQYQLKTSLQRSRGRLFALRCPCIFLQHSPCTVWPPRRRPFQQRNHRRRDHAQYQLKTSLRRSPCTTRRQEGSICLARIGSRKSWPRFPQRKSRRRIPNRGAARVEQGVGSLMLSFIRLHAVQKKNIPCKLTNHSDSRTCPRHTASTP